MSPEPLPERRRLSLIQNRFVVCVIAGNPPTTVVAFLTPQEISRPKMLQGKKNKVRINFMGYP